MVKVRWFVVFYFPLASESCSSAFREVVITPPQKIADGVQTIGKCAKVFLPLAADREEKLCKNRGRINAAWYLCEVMTRPRNAVVL